MPASRRRPRSCALDIADHAAVVAFCRAQKIELRRGRARGAAVRRHRRRSDGRRHQGVRSDQGRPRGSKAPRASPRISAAPTTSRPPPMSASRRPAPAKAYVRVARRADRGEGRRARGRQGRRGGAERRRGGGRDRHDVRGRPWRGRRRGRGRGVPRRRGSVVLRAVRRRERDPARLGAGPQARLRRRPGPQHRRHGRLFAGAGDDAGADPRAPWTRSCCPTVRGHEGDGRALQGRALRRADDHRRRGRS